MKKATIVFLTLCIASAWALGAGTVRIAFDKTDGVVSSIRFSDHYNPGDPNADPPVAPSWTGENGWANFNHNTGGSGSSDIVFSLPNQDWYYPIVMFRPVLPTLPVNAVITDAELRIANNWWNGQVWSNVEIRQIQVPGGLAWNPGTGSSGTRNNTPSDAGIGQWYLDFQPDLLFQSSTNNAGIAWDGVLKNKWTARFDLPRDASSVLTNLITSGTLNGGAGLNTFTGLGQLVKDWYKGVYANEGFALSAMNASIVSGAGANKFMIGSSGGLYITYKDAMPGDANCDDIVDQADYTVWYNNYGATGAIWTQGDFTGDGLVDQADYTVWYNNYGATGAGVPEPVTAMLLLLGLPLLRRRK